MKKRSTSLILYGENTTKMRVTKRVRCEDSRTQGHPWNQSLWKPPASHAGEDTQDTEVLIQGPTMFPAQVDFAVVHWV